MSEHGKSLSSVTPYQQCITRKNKIQKTSDTLITRKELIQEPVNPRKRAKEDTIPYVETNCSKETTPLFWYKVEYKGDTN